MPWRSGCPRHRSRLPSAQAEFKEPKYGEYHIFFSNLTRDSYIQQLAEADEHEVVQQVHPVGPIWRLLARRRSPASSSPYGRTLPSPRLRARPRRALRTRSTACLFSPCVGARVLLRLPRHQSGALLAQHPVGNRDGWHDSRSSRLRPRHFGRAGCAARPQTEASHPVSCSPSSWPTSGLGHSAPTPLSCRLPEASSLSPPPTPPPHQARSSEDPTSLTNVRPSTKHQTPLNAAIRRTPREYDNSLRQSPPRWMIRRVFRSQLGEPIVSNTPTAHDGGPA